eukprot:PhF_6_TR21950/c0_g1_i1/m.31204
MSDQSPCLHIGSREIMLQPPIVPRCGRYAEVFKGIDTATQQRVAIKVWRLHCNTPEEVDKHKEALQLYGYPRHMLRELNLLRRMRHPNVVKLLDVGLLPPENVLPASKSSQKISNLSTETEQSLPAGVITMLNMEEVLVFEYADFSLIDIFNRPYPLPPEYLLHISRQIIECLQYLHRIKTYHRDVKPENFLVSTKCELKLCDFGMARSSREEGDLTPIRTGTSYYRAPEVCMAYLEHPTHPKMDYDEGIDLWGAGCTIAELYLRPKWNDILSSPLYGQYFSETSRYLMATPNDTADSDMNHLHRHLFIIGCDAKSSYLQFLQKQKSLVARPFTGILETILRDISVPRAVSDVIVGLLRLNPADRMRAAECMKLLGPVEQRFHFPITL